MCRCIYRVAVECVDVYIIEWLLRVREGYICTCTEWQLRVRKGVVDNYIYRVAVESEGRCVWYVLCSMLTSRVLSGMETSNLTNMSSALSRAVSP